MQELLISGVIIGSLVWGGVSLFSKDEVETDSYKPQSSYNNTNTSNNGYYYNDYSDYQSEPENPYDDGSGHSAGYEWAEENDVDSCGGNSDSFIEGCQEYLDQQEEYDSNSSDEDY